MDFACGLFGSLLIIWTCDTIKIPKLMEIKQRYYTFNFDYKIKKWTQIRVGYEVWRDMSISYWITSLNISRTMYDTIRWMMPRISLMIAQLRTRNVQIGWLKWSERSMKRKVLNEMFDAWFEVPVPFKLRAFKKKQRSTK